ncbi:hypothetical protein [Frankia gtarii]|uniref:hypothetical protein n=1 Tax=Frankia gtarii TaxID=2950102 RepID=UPI0021C226C8|nr:hypothetical protein [Frankia gtarii]
MAIIMRLADGSIESIATTRGEGGFISCSLATLQPGDDGYDKLNARLTRPAPASGDRQPAPDSTHGPAGGSHRARKADGPIRRLVQAVHSFRFGPRRPK